MEQNQIQELLSTLNNTLLSLSKSAKNDTTIINLTPPTFGGSKNEDIVTWSEAYEETTLPLEDSKEKTLLSRALIGSAKAWFKRSLEDKIEKLSWEEVKQKIMERYRPETFDYYAKQIRELKYNEEDNLESYLGQRIYLARLANPNVSDERLITDSIRTLPPQVREEFNLLKGNSDLKKADELT